MYNDIRILSTFLWDVCGCNKMDLRAAVDQKVIRSNNWLLVTPEFVNPKRKSDDTSGKVFTKTNVY